MKHREGYGWIVSMVMCAYAILTRCCCPRPVITTDVMAYGSAGGFVWGEEGGDDWEEALTENSGSCRRNNRRRGRRHSGAST